MKHLFVIILFIFWLVISGLLLYFIGSFNKIDTYKTFSTDNVILHFVYPKNWGYSIEGNLNDPSGYKFITLLSPNEETIIMIRQFPYAQNKTQCLYYDDCIFFTTPEQFSLNTDNFELISEKYKVYFSRNGGVDYMYDSAGRAILLSTPASAENSYYVYSGDSFNNITTVIHINEKIGVEISYQINREVNKEKIESVKQIISELLHSIKLI